MSTTLSFALVTTFALGIPACVLAFVLLNRKRSLDRLFLSFQTVLLLLMLAEALIFFFRDGISPGDATSAGPMPALRIASHALLAALAFILFLLAAELTAMDRRSAAWKAHAAAILLVSAFVFCYSLATRASDSGYIEKIRHFDPVEDLGLAILLYPIGLALLRFPRIKDKNLARAVVLLLAPGLAFIPAALVEDYVLSRRTAPDLLFVFPCWYLCFNALILYFGVRYFFLPRFSRGTELDPATATRISRRYKVSPREENVVRLLIDGYTNREIASALCISPATVRNHVHSVYEKTGTENRVELTRLYTQR